MRNVIAIPSAVFPSDVLLGPEPSSAIVETAVPIAFRRDTRRSNMIRNEEGIAPPLPFFWM